MRIREMRATAINILNEDVRIAGINSPDIPVEDLAGGQAQAVAIARAAHFKRDILLLDEPTSALSVRETEKVLGIMRELVDNNVSCVFVTYNLYHAFRVCDGHEFLAAEPEHIRVDAAPGEVRAQIGRASLRLRQCRGLGRALQLTGGETGECQRAIQIGPHRLSNWVFDR